MAMGSYFITTIGGYSAALKQHREKTCALILGLSLYESVHGWGMRTDCMAVGM